MNEAIIEEHMEESAQNTRRESGENKDSIPKQLGHNMSQQYKKSQIKEEIHSLVINID